MFVFFLTDIFFTFFFQHIFFSTLICSQKNSEKKFHIFFNNALCILIDLSIAYKSANLIQSDERIGPLVANLGRIAYRLGRAASAADAESVLSTFMNYLTEVGHTQPKSKAAGQGTRDIR